jgi:hypothetical protein
MVNDNSYQQCIDTDCSNHYLGGMRGEIGKTVKVLVQPFKMKIRNIFNEEITLTFIIGLDESTNLRHLILYNF